MIELAEKLISLERDISQEKGSFELFALFLREDSPNKWDLVVSAPWLEEGDKQALNHLIGRLKSHLEPQQLLALSRIVPIEKSNPALDAIHRSIKVEHGNYEVKDSNFFGLQIKHAYIITSKKQKTADEKVT